VVVSFLTAFISLIGMLVLHELGHFLLAKRFGVKVEEFGIGYPPRLIGKKIGGTIYSLNLLPFGAFVRMPGEFENLEDPRSFSQQSVGKRIMIAMGGVVSFWIMAALVLSLVFVIGAPISISDQADGNLSHVYVAVTDVSADSPAAKADLQAGDIVVGVKVDNITFSIDKISQLQELTSEHLGQEMTVVVKRGSEILEANLIPRVSPPQGEGPMGIALIRLGLQSFPWYQALPKGIHATGQLTLEVMRGYIQAVVNISQGQPSGVQMVGPVGVFQMLSQSQQLGFTYFLNFLAVIAIYLAVFNILPIPAMDGGKIMFLLIEAIRKKPVSIKIEQAITAFSFALLLILMVWVTIKDVSRIF